MHYLSGPFEVEGAKPGDLLLVEIMDVQPFESRPWGFTGIFDKSNGGGFLDEMYPSAYGFPSPSLPPYVAIWTDLSVHGEEPRQSGTSKAYSAHPATSRA